MPRKERDPKPMGDLLEILIKGRGWGERMALGRLREAWATVVGEQVAGHSEPVRLARGVLTVRADPGAWANELMMLSSSLAAKAHAYLDGPPVKEVRVVTGAPR